MASVVPALIDALVAQATAALADVSVYDGYGVGDDPGDFLMIGVDDPDSQVAAFSTESSQAMASFGSPHARSQAGSVTCAALSWNGNRGNVAQKSARDAAYAIQAAVESLLRADPTLGIAAPNQMPLTVEMGDERLSQNQYEAGCDALLIFTVKFTTWV